MNCHLSGWRDCFRASVARGRRNCGKNLVRSVVWKTSNIQHPIASTLQSCAANVSKKATVAWAQFVATVSLLEAKEVCASAAKMIRLVVEAGYEDFLKENYANYRSEERRVGK